MNEQKLEKNIHDLLINLDIPLDKEVLYHTPKRVTQFFKEALAGYLETPMNHEKTFVNQGAAGLVIVEGIEFHSLCQHHLLPFFGTVALGYIPRDKLSGLSKFSRIVHVFARRLQLQEKLTIEILQALETVLDPFGVGVVVKAKHLCMTARGTKESAAVCTTAEFSGVFQTDTQLRQEFFNRIKGDHI